MRLLNTCLVTLILLFFTATGKAQLLMIRNFAPSYYSSSTQNWGVAEGFGGQMFFGNNRGLLSYDGDEWTLSFVANYTSVRSVLMSSDGKLLYAGATDEFGYFQMSGQSKQLVYTSLSAQLPHPFKSGEIWHIKTVGHMTYFQSKGAVFVFRDNRYVSTVKFEESLENIFTVSGRVLADTDRGLYEIDDGRAELLPGTTQLNGKKVRGIAPYGKQWLMITERDGLFLYDGTNCHPFDDSLSQFLKQSNVFCAEVHGSTVAFGTVKGGLAVANFATGERHFANVLTGLQNKPCYR